ncbi:lysine--tRNA ligase [Candidatus Uhrbacteria bacterium RIFCSPHIGHO2_01_FULL_63_20]|uniref:Lysine--tRNA ligase n=1 Tax=Candidatus Uhrbacteria bacterium RIFCSPHIGHO2_01_FULL_63_20 TaxID=1802385 RepID=A0A1F7TLQ4_9BACT|nr:MAG: lysine--tRNA ligase [Candidatus Uhrbacteria bacterium RIFCSPHIGHO2_01_FULL_63_20]
MIDEEVVRRERLAKLRAAGEDPYPARVKRTHEIAGYLARFDALLASKEPATLVGRVKTIRKHGGLTFAHIEDGTGIVQVALHRDVVGSERYAFFHATADMGDFLEVTGTAFVTRKGENSIDASAWRIITKTLLPMPEKWHGLNDVEIRYRKRYLDLIANPDVRRIFRMRAVILKTMREHLDRHGYLEVETPVLQAVPGGAAARPFVTHHNALDIDMYLRIAPELYLKRLTVGGYERVYEVARCFRNEGIDHMHNPEFTQVEGYAAYMDYADLMAFLEGMVFDIVKACGHDPAKVPFQGSSLDFTPPWPRVTFRDALIRYAGVDIEKFPDRAAISKEAQRLGVPVANADSHTTIIDNIYKHFVRTKIVQPTYLIDYPVEISPLAKRKGEDPRYVEMFQLVYGPGVENVKAFTELNDPLDQEERFRVQDEAREKGDLEAQYGDADYVEALKHGMPPTSGFGIGIDRLTATLTDSHSLKEVILFPTLRPESSH